MSAKMSGTLAMTPIHEICRWVWENRFTGVLVLARNEVKKSIIFDKGKPVGARSNIKDEALGSILIAEKRITSAQLQKSLQTLSEREGTRHGEVLLEMKIIDPSLLYESLRRQFYRRFYETFTWEDGKYALVDEGLTDQPKVDLPESLPELCIRALLEKYRKHSGTTMLSVDLKPLVMSNPQVPLEQLKLVGREMGFVRLINGTTTVSELLTKSKFEEESAKALLLALRDLKVIRLGNEVVQEESKIVSPGPSSPSASKKITVKPTHQLMKQIVERMEAAQKQNFFGILGVKENASDTDIKKAYFELAKNFHPDRVPASVTPEEKRLAEQYFAMVTEAHATLGNAKLRKEYDAKLEVQASGVDEMQVNDIIQSEMEFQKGRVLIKKGDFTGAIELLEQAIKLYDKEPEYHAILGWAQFRAGKTKNNSALSRKGKENLQKAVKDNPNLGEAFYFLGMVEKAEGNVDRAKGCFQKTIEKLPHHAEAASELRHLSRSEEKKATSKSGMMGMFGKKK